MIEKFFDEKLSLIIFRKIAELIDFLHKIGLTHTNLELDNFLLDADKNLLIIIELNKINIYKK
jgi:serine/threonine protein kinase